MLRIADLSMVEGLDLAVEVERELQREPLTWHSTSAVYGLAAITVDFAAWTNTARGSTGPGLCARPRPRDCPRARAGCRQRL